MRLQRFFSSSSNDPINTAPTDVEKAAEKPSTARVDLLQVSVLIAMPSPPKHLKSSGDSISSEGEDPETIPEVVFGVTRLPYQHSNLQHPNGNP